MTATTFTARFTDCEHTRELPLLHSAGHVNCFVCQPELREQPIKGACPDCDDAKMAMYSELVRIEEKTHQAYLELELRDGDNGPDVPSFEIGVKFDGCVHLRRFYNGVKDDADYFHICDIDQVIRLLQAVKQKAKEHFGEDWK